MSEQTPEPPDEEPATAFEPLDLDVPEVDWIERGGNHGDIETRDIPED